MSESDLRIERYRLARERVLERIDAACARSGRRPAEVTLVAVSKTVPADALRDAVAAGLDLLGENRVQEGAAKVAEVPGARWHLVGPLQSNKARRALEVFDSIESVDSVELAERLDRLVRAVRPGTRYPVLLQVNVDVDPAKAGFQPGDLAAALGPIGEPQRHRRPWPHDDRAAGGAARGCAIDVPVVARDIRTTAWRQRLDRGGPVDGHDRRLRARHRGGSDDRAGRSSHLWGACPRSRPWSRRGPPPLTSRAVRSPSAGRLAATSSPSSLHGVPSETLSFSSCRFAVRLTPRSAIERVEDVVDGVLKVRVMAPAVEGAANTALVRLLADELGIARRDIQIVAGATSRQKLVVVDGIDPEAIVARWPGLRV